MPGPEAMQRQLVQQQTGEVFMEWLAENWFSVLIGIVFVGMHMFGHGGHAVFFKTVGTDFSV